MAVATLHTAIAGAVFSDVFQAILSRGVFDAVGPEPTSGRAVWFALFGAELFIVGLAVDQLEYHCPDLALRPLGVSLLLLAGSIPAVLLPGEWPAA